MDDRIKFAIQYSALTSFVRFGTSVGFLVRFATQVVDTGGAGACLAAGATPPSAETLARLAPQVRLSTAYSARLGRT